MTLIIGLDNGKEAILAADSKASNYLNNGGFYAQQFPKLRIINEDCWIIGVANSSIGYDLIQQVAERGETFNHNVHIGVHKYAKRMHDLYLELGYTGLVLSCVD